MRIIHLIKTEIMKKYAILFCCVIASLLLGGCEKLGRKVLGIKNNADYDIMVYHPLIWNSDKEEENRLQGYYVYPENTLSPWMPSKIKRVKKNEDEVLYAAPYYYYFEDLRDTTSIFIFNADSLDLYGWDSMFTHNILIQRYDVTAEMLVKFEGADENHGDWIERIAFPPTKRMGEMIKMWPPYGTYDENGHRIEK